MQTWYYVYPFPVRSRSVNEGGGIATSSRYTFNNRYPWELRQPYSINYTTRELYFKDNQTYYNEHKINLNDEWKLSQLINHVMRLLNYRVSQLFEFSNAAIKSHSLYGDTTSNVYNYYTGIAESPSYLGNRFRYPDPMPNPAAAFYIYYPEDYMTSYDYLIDDNFINNDFVIKTLMDTYKEINGLYTGRYNETDTLRIWRRFVSKDNSLDQYIDDKYKYYDDLFKTYDYNIDNLNESDLNISKGSIWDAWTACFAQLYYCQYYYKRTEGKPPAGWRLSSIEWNQNSKEIFWDKGSDRNISVDIYRHHPILSYPDSSGSTVWWTDYYNGGNGVVGKRWRENPFTDPWDEGAFWLYDKTVISWVDNEATGLSINYPLFDGVLSNNTWNGWYAQFEMYWSFADFRKSYNRAMGYEAIPPFFVPTNTYFLNNCEMTEYGLKTSSEYGNYRIGGIYTIGPNVERYDIVEGQSYENPKIIPDHSNIFYSIEYDDDFYNTRITDEVYVPTMRTYLARVSDDYYVTINNAMIHNGLPDSDKLGQQCVDVVSTKITMETYGSNPPPTTTFPYNIHIVLKNGDVCLVNDDEYYSDTVILGKDITIGGGHGNSVTVKLFRQTLPTDHQPIFTTTLENKIDATDILTIKHHFTNQVEDLGRRINQVTVDASDMHFEHIPGTTFIYSTGRFRFNEESSYVYFTDAVTNQRIKYF